jgi:serine/threonine protein kinase
VTILDYHGAARNRLSQILHCESAQKVTPNTLKRGGEEMMKTGDRIGGYELLEILGEGGMAEVWKARNIALERIVAIKFLLERFINDPDLQQRFLQEGRLQARLQHPQIVGILHAGAENGRAFLVTDFVEGESLEQLLQAHGGKPLPVEEVLSISYDVLSALDYAHNLPQGAIVHRDVKPSNILLDGKGRARLADFGIAVALNEDRKTKTGFALGSVFYMSPEQIQTPRAIDWRSDLYSFGCVLYEMLTGRPPFGGDTDSDFTIKQAHVQTPPEPMRKWNPQVPFEFEWIVFRALSKDRERRFASAAEMADALRPIVPGPRREKRTPTVVERAPEAHKIESRPPVRRAVEPEKEEEVKAPEPVRRGTKFEAAEKKPGPLWKRLFWPDFETPESVRLAINIAALTMALAALGLLSWGFFGSLGNSEHQFLLAAGLVCAAVAEGIRRRWKIMIVVATLPAVYLAVGGLTEVLTRLDRFGDARASDFLLTGCGALAGVVLVRALKATLGPQVVPAADQTSIVRVELKSRAEKENANPDPRFAWKRLFWPDFRNRQGASQTISTAAFMCFLAGLAILGNEIANYTTMQIDFNAAALIAGTLALGVWKRWRIAVISALIAAFLGVLVNAGDAIEYMSNYMSQATAMGALLQVLIGSLLLVLVPVYIRVLRDRWLERSERDQSGGKLNMASAVIFLVVGVLFAALLAFVFRYQIVMPILVILGSLIALGPWQHWKITMIAALVLSPVGAFYFGSHMHEGRWFQGSWVALFLLMVSFTLVRALRAVILYQRLNG